MSYRGKIKKIENIVNDNIGLLIYFLVMVVILVLLSRENNTETLMALLILAIYVIAWIVLGIRKIMEKVKIAIKAEEFYIKMGIVFAISSVIVLGLCIFYILINRHVILASDGDEFQRLYHIGGFLGGTLGPLLTFTTISFIAANYFHKSKENIIEHNRYNKSLELKKNKDDLDKWETIFHKTLERIVFTFNEKLPVFNKEGEFKTYTTLHDAHPIIEDITGKYYREFIIHTSNPNSLGSYFSLSSDKNLVEHVCKNCFDKYTYAKDMISDIPDKDGINRKVAITSDKFIDIFLGDSYKNIACLYFLLAGEGFFNSFELIGDATGYFPDKIIKTYTDYLSTMRLINDNHDGNRGRGGVNP